MSYNSHHFSVLDALKSNIIVPTWLGESLFQIADLSLQPHKVEAVHNEFNNKTSFWQSCVDRPKKKKKKKKCAASLTGLQATICCLCSIETLEINPLLGPIGILVIGFGSM